MPDYAGDLARTQGAMTGAEGILSEYTSELPSQIDAEIKKAWTPALEGAVGVTERQMSEFLPRFWNLPETLGSTTAADLSPTQKLGFMGQELGTMAGSLTASQRASDYLGAQMTDLYDKAITAMNMGRQEAADAYARAFGEYQLAWQENEAEKNRQLQIKLANMNRGGGSGGSVGGDGEMTDVKAKFYADAATLRRRRSTHGLMEGEIRAPVNESFSYLQNQSKVYGLGISDAEIWSLLGNTPSTSGGGGGGSTSVNVVRDYVSNLDMYGVGGAAEERKAREKKRQQDEAMGRFGMGSGFSPFGSIL